MLEYLKEIKEELFDAPVDVKEAFNSIVGWFDDSKFIVIREPRPSYKYYFKVTTESNFISHNKKAEASRKGKGAWMQNWIKMAGPFNTKGEAEKKMSELDKSYNSDEEIKKREKAPLKIEVVKQ